MTDSPTMASLTAPLPSLRHTPVDGAGLVERLRLTLVSLGYALSFVPSLALGILVLLSIPLGLVTVGFVLALGAVPAMAALVSVHRRVSGALLGEEIPPAYADTGNTNAVTRPARWLRDRARWRDVALVWFSATGGFVLSLVPVALLTSPAIHLTGAVLDGGWVWWLLAAISTPLLAVWWLITPALVRARALAERGILVGSRIEELEHRVEEVEETRTATLDHNAAELRRIERDLHDGAQARIAAVGMTVGLAEKLMASDPQAAADLLREARETTVGALEDLRAVVRGIHPPVLADLGLGGAVEGLALSLPLPVTVTLAAERLPAPVESAAYFAVAECLTNTVKHADATRAWVHGGHDGTTLRITVGDDGRGGADPSGSGLSGIAGRLAAFDGRMRITSPRGGGTTVHLEVPCRVA